MSDILKSMDADSLLPLPPPVFHILIALAGGPAHGYAIMRDVRERTGGRLKLGPGTLYGSIKRMLEQGLIEEVRKPPSGPGDDERRRYYRLTRLGRRAAEAEAARLADVLREAKAHGLLPQRG
jgi:DNA-binding PadR family transcriptional regulator